MKFAILNTTLLTLLFALLVVNASDPQLPWQSNGVQLAAADPATRFQDECGQCHGEADEFVRESLTFKNGTLTGLGSDMPVLDFLKTHRKLKPVEVDFYEDLLTRMAGEIGLQ